MKAKARNYVRQTIHSVILAGGIIIVIGLYYCVIKAGIPYQDPPLELQIKYAIYIGTGKLLLKNGFILSICGGFILLFWKFIQKK